MKRAAPQSSPSSTRQLFRIRFVSSVLGRRRGCGAALSVFVVCFLSVARLLLLHVSGLLLARSRSGARSGARSRGRARSRSGGSGSVRLVDPVPLGFCATATVVASANAHSKTRNLFIDESPIDPTSLGKFGRNAREYIPAQC